MPAFPTLGRRADFEKLARSGVARSCRLLVLRARKTDDEVTRVGMSTPRAIGGSVMRNRLRRRLREAIRPRYPPLASGWHLLVIARPAAADASVADLGLSLDGLLRRCGVAR